MREPRFDEPLYLHTDALCADSIVDGDGNAVGSIPRLVKCWNACAGIPDAELEGLDNLAGLLAELRRVAGWNRDEINDWGKTMQSAAERLMKLARGEKGGE